MFKNLNLEEKIKLKSLLSQSSISIIGSIALIALYKVQIHHESGLNWGIGLLVVAIISIILIEIIQKIIIIYFGYIFFSINKKTRRFSSWNEFSRQDYKNQGKNYNYKS